MNKDLSKTIVLRSLFPLFFIIAFFAHPYVSHAVLFCVWIIIMLIVIHNADKKRKKGSQSVTLKGLIHAAIAAPFLMISVAALLFAVLFSIIYLQEKIGRNASYFTVLVIIFLIWIIDIIITVRKDRKTT